MRRAAAAIAATVLLLLGASACESTGKKEMSSAEVMLQERMAAVLLREGRAPEAEKVYRDILPQDPKNPEVHDGLGAALLIQGKPKDAESSFDKAVDLAPDRALYLIHRATARIQRAKFSEAAQDLQQAEQLGGPTDRFDIALQWGELRQRMGEFAGAEVEYSKALTIGAQDLFAAYFGRGVARESQGNFEGAAEDYLESVRLRQRSAEANLRLGLALVQLRRVPLGRRYLERTVELDPGGESGERARILLDSIPATPPKGAS
jgi:tetratricopeptide (TPR) repeat protein